MDKKFEVQFTNRVMMLRFVKWLKGLPSVWVENETFSTHHVSVKDVSYDATTGIVSWTADESCE